MADELTSTVSAPETPSTQVGQVPPASQPEPQPEKPVSDTPAKTQEKKPVNLQEFPEFKEYQRQTNRTIEETRRQAQQRIAQLEAQLEQIATRDMTDEELSQREKLRLQQQLEQQQAQYQQLYQTYARDLAMNEIARRAGVDPSVLREAENPDDAWELAHKAKLAEIKAQMESEYKDKLAAQPGNTPDLGGGRAMTPKPVDQISGFKSDADLRETYRRLWDEYQS
jgi:DNA repair exonuclease SbcCD ATPase subunit